ncbi:MAG: metal ABC transporter ATP-binding protein [Thermoplasmata archaeon]
MVGKKVAGKEGKADVEAQCQESSDTGWHSHNIKERCSDTKEETMKEETIIEAKNLNVTRGGTVVIKDAAFAVKRGDYVGIVGPNGGGKTTLIRTLLGLIPFEKGEIRLFGQDISDFKSWDKIAYVSQHATAFEEDFPLTVKELVLLGRLNKSRMLRPFNKEDEKAVEEALELMGIKDLKDRRIGNLSGGQKQRCFIAKALVRQPEVMFLDEPISGVDPQTQSIFYKLLSNLNRKKGITILIVSHDLTAVFCRMSKVICVNRDVYAADISEDTDPNEIIRKSYGEHFHFAFHRHECRGDFA